MRVLVTIFCIALSSFCWVMVLIALYRSYGVMSSLSIILLPFVCMRMLALVNVPTALRS
ncbi:MAG: hypothetical protein KA760_11830 [Steroidobacteraceae bacterium]|nr:hypothetical protein [Steroidobacteraceae bacterium]